MGYKDVVNEFDGEVVGESLNTTIHKWKEAGDSIAGELLAIEDFKFSKFENTCKQYIFKTDEGRVSCVLGQSMDCQLENVIKVGNIYYIMYNGKMDLEDGRSVNRFNIVDITKEYKEAQIKPREEKEHAE